MKLVLVGSKKKNNKKKKNAAKGKTNGDSAKVVESEVAGGPEVEEVDADLETDEIETVVR